MHSPKLAKNVQHWQNQNHFLQARHGHDQYSQPEVILVGICPSDDAFKLLSWAISVSARPGDKVIALQLKPSGSKIENLIGKLQTEQIPNVTDAQQQALAQLCEVKQVKLDFRISLTGNEELELVEESNSVHATMLVLSPHHSSRSLQKRINSLVKKLPDGCSVVVVKECKVVLYMENTRKDAYPAGDSCYTTPVSKSRNSKPESLSLQRQSSSGSRPLWSEEDVCSPSSSSDSKSALGNRIWPIQTPETSPTGVLDNYEFSPSSDTSLPSSSKHRRRFLSFLSSKDRPKRSNLFRNGSFQRTVTFPPDSRMKKYSGPLEFTSIRSPLKFMANLVQKSDTMTDMPSIPTSEVTQSWKCFTFLELAFATDDFSEENMVGMGGHSEVFKGKLLDGRNVAIKRLKKSDSDVITETDFLTELGIIAHVSHPNTTPLVGFCVEEGLHLVFDFSLNGSLATILHTSDASAPAMDWSLRYKVAVGIAKGLHYLHTACPRRIIHRDIKASNILLDIDFEPQISDFGLAKWLPDQCNQMSVFPVEGTFGYLAPEYFMHGIINEKTDVFAFGVLLLELITGRLPIDESQKSLVIWAKPFLESSRVEDLADPKLRGEYDHREMSSMVQAANICVQSSPTLRPDMAQVLELLTNDNFTMPSTVPDCYEGSCEEYSPANYLSDLSRHREIALQF